MARPLRIEYPGAVYHITARGNARQDIFLENADRSLFLRVLAHTVTRYNWLCHAYCLMGNHYHLLLETPDPNLSLGMRHLNGVYTQRFNRKHSRVGHVFQGRFKSVLVEKEVHLLELCRYIVLNPVAAKMVFHPSEHPWSSYNFTAKSIKKPTFLSIDWVLGQFSKKRRDARRLYQEFVVGKYDGNNDNPWKKLVGQVILGSDDFVTYIQDLIAEKKEIKEIPKLQRYSGRPPLSRLFSVGSLNNKKKRNESICNAHLSYGYTLKEIGEYLGIHYTTVSRIVNNDKI
jgi:REP-associated tyrosine transposase